MNRLAHAILIALAALPAAGPAATPREAVTARNIFDPTRRPDQPAVRDEAPPPPAAPRTDALVLTGSLVYPGRQVAFFSGSDPAYNAVRAPSESVGGFVVEEITTAHVVLKLGEDRFTLPVGRQLQRTGDAPWQVAERPAAGPAPTPAPSATGVPAAAPASPAPSAEMNDVMRRLLERRRQELSP